ncbi:uncharacterized protein VTP21DRAFT_10423 [Calcarisporiella thermophila]|uniref:uncharacterized protein n=1 Tax=Calcarisporiella thermophila TaxID=911321 RepID=UPI003742C85B
MSSTPTDIRNQVQDFYDNLARTADELIHVRLPSKLLELNRILDEETKSGGLFDIAGIELVNGCNEEEPNKKRKLNSLVANEVPSENPSAHIYLQHADSNPRTTRLLEMLKKEGMELVETLSKIRLWIHLQMPRIEDGDNLGVSIQEEVVSELARAEDSAVNILDAATKHYATRAKLSCKLIKYPNVEDYQRSISYLDQKDFVNWRLSFEEIRNSYAVLYDSILKNLEKIKKPKGNNSTHLY